MGDPNYETVETLTWFMISLYIKQSVCPCLNAPPPDYILGPIEMKFLQTGTTLKKKICLLLKIF